MAVRDVATSSENYRASAGGYLAEIDPHDARGGRLSVGASGEGDRLTGYGLAAGCANDR